MQDEAGNFDMGVAGSLTMIILTLSMVFLMVSFYRRYKISVRDLSTEHSCSLVAKDIDKNTVGEVVDLMPARSLAAGENQRTVEISTRLPAVNAGIASCQ